MRYNQEFKRFTHPLQEEVAKAYWLTNMHVGQVAKMFQIQSVAHVWRIAGPHQLDSHCCKDCGQAIEVYSRDELKARREKIAKFKEPHIGLSAAHPLLCRACANTLYHQECREWDKQAEARSVRNSWLRSLAAAEFYEQPEWQTIRDHALSRAEHRCQICNFGSLNLCVVLRSMRQIPHPNPSETTVLCSNCADLLDVCRPGRK